MIIDYEDLSGGASIVSHGCSFMQLATRGTPDELLMRFQSRGPLSLSSCRATLGSHPSLEVAGGGPSGWGGWRQSTSVSERDGKLTKSNQCGFL